MSGLRHAWRQRVSHSRRENRVGAGGNIAADAVVHAAADGYTLLLVMNAHAINASLYDTPNFNVMRDIRAVV
jgi:tripartite-type tricarboxylate transporter receptor subunit TctC